MPRMQRYTSRSGWAHIILRGINRENLFYDEGDYLRFKRIFARYCNECGVDYAIVCLMSNHVHMLVRENEGVFSKVMKKITVSYAQYYNKKLDRVGPVFQDRYRCEPVETERYFLTVVRYIFQNPQKAGICPAGEYSHTLLNKEGLLTGYFSDEDDLMDFLERKNDDCCMEYDRETKISDQEVMNLLTEMTGSDNPQYLQKADKNQRIKILRILKMNGVPIRTISRLTGLNRNLVQRA